MCHYKGTMCYVLLKCIVKSQIVAYITIMYRDVTLFHNSFTLYCNIISNETVQ